MSGGATRVRRLSIRDFRNLAPVTLDLPAEGVVLIGDNGQGKTSFLEAVYYLQILRSARGAHDAEVVRFGAEGFHLAAAVDGSPRAHEVGVGYERAGRQKRVRLDGAIIGRLGDAVGALPAVMFAPSDMALVAGGPAARRRFLDIALALTSRSYLVALQGYRAALVRRNRVLREHARHGAARHTLEAQIAVWEPALAAHGAVLADERRTWVD
ncbi:MAG TPA: DNA replication and repair protein RecF, partial [Gemmatimonadaceae bacterium]|nr:DNA replication and repair protein RecF [Gemmatimonadaceae bacterium]